MLKLQSGLNEKQQLINKELSSIIDKEKLVKLKINMLASIERVFSDYEQKR